MSPPATGRKIAAIRSRWRWSKADASAWAKRFTCPCRTAPSRWRLPAWCSSTRRGSASMAKAAAKTVQEAAGAERRPALGGQDMSAGGVKVAVLPPANRVSLRVRQEAVASLSRALGVALPQKPKTSAAKGGRTVFWLGPDEWLVLDEQGGDALAD